MPPPASAPANDFPDAPMAPQPPAAPPGAAAYFPPGYARQQDSAAPRLIAAFVALVYAAIEIWGLASQNAWAPIPREGWSYFSYAPWEIKMTWISGIALLVFVVLAIVVSGSGRIACGILLLLTSGAYLAGPLIYFGHMHELGAWIRHSGANSWTLLAVGVVGVAGAVAYLATSASRRN
jgi:hypothetical protein